jgi:hypothetical protein
MKRGFSYCPFAASRANRASGPPPVPRQSDWLWYNGALIMQGNWSAVNVMVSQHGASRPFGVETVGMRRSLASVWFGVGIVWRRHNLAAVWSFGRVTSGKRMGARLLWQRVRAFGLA